jgi:hypothetical protein
LTTTDSLLLEIGKRLEADTDTLSPEIVKALRRAGGFAGQSDEELAVRASTTIQVVSRAVAQKRLLTTMEVMSIVGSEQGRGAPRAWWEAVNMIWRRGLKLVRAMQTRIDLSYLDQYDTLLLGMSYQVALAAVQRNMRTPEPVVERFSPLARLIRPVAGEPASPREIAERMGLSLTAEHVVVTVSERAPEESTALIDAIRLHGPQPVGYVERFGDFVTWIQPLPKSDATNAVEAVTATLTEMNVFGGISQPARTVEKLPAAYEQARRALAVALLMPAKPVLSFDLALVYEILLKDPSLARELNDSILSDLVAYDRENGTSLLETLDAVIASLGKAAAAADLLHVHRHTVSDRVVRIEQITGRRLDDGTDIRILDLALRARELLEGADPGRQNV